MLSAAQMGQMSRLLEQALELDEPGRRHWLEALAPEHKDLLPALRRALLSEGDEVSGSQEFGTLPNIGAGIQINPIGAQAGDLVGPYRLIRPLGAGGMAEVWLAQRADGAFKREVALKLPILSRLRKDLASRFSRERDILAALEHPNIARLYDAGVSAEGLPYLAMEFVAGQPLIVWCNAHRLGIRERLKLFLQVLDAVQYAHGHQVIHRDIKPSNILVSDSGQVRLLDFGVAKLLAQEEEQTELTQIYGRALTPEYASPELVRGEPIDAAADVYSLGVVLYELLSGSRPYRIKAGASMALLEQAIATAQVQRPSTEVGPEAGADRSTTQDKLARRLRGDLDAIVLKALAKAPEDRYRGAAALTNDLQRYLSSDPVGARPARPTYLIGKFVQRHRTGVATTAAVALLVAAVAGYELNRQSGTGQIATNASLPVSGSASAVPVISEKSIAVLPFVDMSEKHDQEYFSDGLAEEVLNLLSRVPKLRVAARTSAFSFKGKSDDIPTIARKLLVANVLEGSVRKSGSHLRITAQLVRAENGYHLWSQTYDRNLDDIFKVQDEIASAVVKALEVSLLADSLPRATGAGNIEAYTLYLQGRAILLRVNSVKDLEKAADYLQMALKLDPSFAPSWVWLSVAHALQAGKAVPLHKGFDQARREAIQALKLDPNLSEAHSIMAFIHLNYDWDWAGTEDEARKALELDPNNLWAWLQRGDLAALQRHDDMALQSYQKAVEIDPLNSIAYSALGDFKYKAGHFAEAQTAYQKMFDLDPGNYWGGAYGPALLKLAIGDPTAALAEFERVTREEFRLQGRALAYHAIGRKAEADVALAELKKKYGEKYGYRIAEVFAFRGNGDMAFFWLDRAYRQREAAILELTSDPLFKGLRSDPRFSALLVKMKVADEVIIRMAQ